MVARIQKFCGGEIGAVALEYTLIAAGFSTAIVALVRGVPI